MKTLKEQILRILIKIKNVLVEDELTGSDYPGLTHKFHTKRIGDNEVASEIEYIIKEFVEYCLGNVHWDSTYNGYFDMATMKTFDSVDELYDYWNTNIKS